MAKKVAIDRRLRSDEEKLASLEARKKRRAEKGVSSRVRQLGPRQKLLCPDCGKARRKHKQTGTRCRDCSFKHRAGEMNSNWKGGKKSASSKIRASEEYAAWRKAVFERDCYRCVICGAKGEMHADHIKPFAFFPELRLDIGNGRTLCVSCHKKTDTYMGRVFKWAKENLTNPIG